MREQCRLAWKANPEGADGSSSPTGSQPKAESLSLWEADKFPGAIRAATARTCHRLESFSTTGPRTRKKAARGSCLFPSELAIEGDDRFGGAGIMRGPGGGSKKTAGPPLFFTTVSERQKDKASRAAEFRASVCNQHGCASADTSGRLDRDRETGRGSSRTVSLAARNRRPNRVPFVQTFVAGVASPCKS